MPFTPEDQLALLLDHAHIPYVREYRFAPPRRWRIDFACPDHQLAVEVEGGVWVTGRHVRPSGFIKDIEKYNHLTLLGWRLLRVIPDMIVNGEALNLIQSCLSDKASVAQQT
jgi:very-short-patch-repair endonuclease